MTDPAIIGVVGWKNSGKTTLTVELVSELTRRGFRVSTIKHAHVTFEVDHPGRDSFRHREAGAMEVAIASPRRWALLHELRGAPEPSLEEMVARMSPCDLIVVEGYKRGPHPKIEIRRHGARQRDPIASDDSAVIAVVSDTPEAEPDALPIFANDHVPAVASFILERLGLPSHRAAAP